MIEEAVLFLEINILLSICRADSDQNQSAMENVNGTNRNVPEQYQCASSKSNIHHEYPYWIYELLDHAKILKNHQIVLSVILIITCIHIISLTLMMIII
ncbi:hypothetical protein ZOSMA_621G00030 [Zostera marina]|uniref:Uncharacterized protein n=1 Tax=Zostera marina TaxID=29655 RepID=A0A0K9NVL0_ZOSMR|nr:hypothetical protein ZOSMA_621G00030 [Zostera marina]